MISPRQQAEILSVADDLDKLSLKKTANRLRTLLGEQPDDERPCVIQDRIGGVAAIPWGLAEILYPAYGFDQTLQRMHERGGFSRNELGMLAADCYGSNPGQVRPRLKRMPLLDLYEMAKRGSQSEEDGVVE